MTTHIPVALKIMDLKLIASFLLLIYRDSHSAGSTPVELVQLQDTSHKLRPTSISTTGLLAYHVLRCLANSD